jgi:hypothetical protein
MLYLGVQSDQGAAMSKCLHYYGKYEEGCLRPLNHEGPHEFAIVLREQIRELKAEVAKLKRLLGLRRLAEDLKMDAVNAAADGP